MSILNYEKVYTNELGLRGLGEQWHSLNRYFKSLEDANAAKASGDWVPTPGKMNSVIVAGSGIMTWSFDLEQFVLLSEFQAAGNQASRYIHLNGAGAYLGFDNAGNVMDLNHDWSIGHTLVGVAGPSSFKKMTLFSRGGFHVTLSAQEITDDNDEVIAYNWGLYVTSDNDLFNADKRAQANTWYAPGNFSRIMITYNATTKRLKYHLGDPSTGTYATRGNLLLPQTMIDGQNIAGGIKVGDSWTGVGGSNFSGISWDGGVNNLVGSETEFTGPFLQEYFQNQSVDPDNPSGSFELAEFYGHLAFHCKLGEDDYDDVTDEKGFLTGGKLYNGLPSDFKDMPSS